MHESLLSEASFLSTVSHDVRTPMNAIICKPIDILAVSEALRKAEVPLAF